MVLLAHYTKTQMQKEETAVAAATFNASWHSAPAYLCMLHVNLVTFFE